MKEPVLEEIKIAAYCRVSTDKDDQLSSLETQKQFFEEYAAFHRYHLVELYADEGISGTKLKNRKAFNKMMADARKGCFQRVFVKDISRFARNAVDFLNSIRELKAMGIKCEFVNANLSTEDGEFTLGILALVAQEESSNLSKRVKFGKTKNAEKGKVPNFVFGYDKTPGDLFHLNINEKEASVVKKIFRLYTIDQYGTGKIAQLLNQDGLRTKRGCLWSQNAVSRILTNPIYIGSVINGKEEVADFLTGIRKKRPQDNWLVSENKRLAIVDGETFQTAQKRLEENRRTFQKKRKRESGKYLFSSLIQCQCCSYGFRRVHKTFLKGEYTKWVCSGRNTRGNTFCQNHTVLDENELAEEILTYLKGFAANESQFVKKTVSEVKKYFESTAASEEQKEVTDNLNRLKKAKSKQTQMYEMDIITLEELKKRTEELNNSISHLSEKIKLLTPQNNKNIRSLLSETSLDTADKIICRDNLTYHLLRQVVDHILVKENGEIEVYIKKI